MLGLTMGFSTDDVLRIYTLFFMIVLIVLIFKGPDKGDSL
jgi:hypothetical protein